MNINIESKKVNKFIFLMSIFGVVVFATTCLRWVSIYADPNQGLALSAAQFASIINLYIDIFVLMIGLVAGSLGERNSKIPTCSALIMIFGILFAIGLNLFLVRTEMTDTQINLILLLLALVVYIILSISLIVLPKKGRGAEDGK